MGMVHILIIVLSIFALVSGICLFVFSVRELWAYFVISVKEKEKMGQKIHPRISRCIDSEHNSKRFNLSTLFLWIRRLLLPDFLFGNPSLFTNIKTIFKNPNFRPLRLAFFSFFIFNICIIGLSVQIFRTAPVSNAASYSVSCTGSSGTPTAITEATYTGADDLTLEDGGDGYCILDEVLYIANLTIDAGVTLVHAAEDPTGVKINATGDVTVNGDINVLGKGCADVSAGNGKGPNGTSYDSYTCVASNAGYGRNHGDGTPGGGGGHGGGGGDAIWGAIGGTTYGNSANPVLLGSSGAGSNISFNNTAGGDGGGLVWISASGTLTLGGSILTSGGGGGIAANGGGGGGSGGSIILEVDALTGSGTVRSDGGDGGLPSAGTFERTGGGGGGGRVYLNYCTDGSSFTTSTDGGNDLNDGTYDGDPGTWVAAEKDAEDCNSAPTATDPTFTTTSTGSGYVEVTTQISDADADNVQLRIEHKLGNCSSYTDFSSTTLSTVVSVDSGTPSVDNSQVAGLQISAISTAAANNVTSTWFSATDQSSANGTYCVFVTPYDGAAFGTTVSSTVVLDNVSPSASSALTVNATGTTYAILNLSSAVTETNFAEYKIFYKQGSSGVTESDTAFTSTTDANLASKTFNSATETTITGLSAGTQYVANIYAYDTYGNTSTAVSELTFYTLNDQVSSASVVNSTNTTTLQLQLSWSNPSPAQTGMKITRDNGCDGSFDVTIYDDSEVNDTTPTTTVASLSVNTCYDYLIQTYNADGAINSSTLAAATSTITTPPGQPQSVTADSVTTGQIVWNWDDVTGANTFVVYNNANGSLIAETADATSGYTQTGLSGDTQYCILVRAKSSSNGEGIASTSVCTYTEADIPTGLTHSDQTGSSIIWDWTDGGQTDFLARDKNNVADNSGVILTNTWTQTSLATNTAYTLEVQARNADAVETSFAEITRYTEQNAIDSLAFSSVSATGLTVTAENTAGAFPNNGTGSAKISFYNQQTGVLQDVTSGASWSPTGLSPNVQYTITASSTNGDEDRTAEATSSTYTLAEIPGAATINNLTETTLDLAVSAGDNSAATTYAIFSGTDDAWIAADGSTSASAIYQTAANWGTITLTGLTGNTGYQYTTLAKNSNSLITASSTSSTIAYTSPPSSGENGGDLVATTTESFTLNSAIPRGVIDGTPGGGTGAITQVTVPNTIADSTGATVDFGRMLQNRQVNVTNQITITRQSNNQENNFQVTIPAATVLTADSDSWDGQVTVPTVRDTGEVQANGAHLVIEVGSSQYNLTFDQAVRLLLPYQRGKIAAFQRPGETQVTVINLECTSPTDSSNIGGNGECWVNSGDDLIIWTKHFTKFVSINKAGGIYTPTTPSPIGSPSNSGSTQLVNAIDINNGAEKTNSRDVQLVLNVFGATMVALSNTPDFVNSVFVPFSRIIPWVLESENGLKNVYAKFRTAEGGTLTAFDSIILSDSYKESEGIEEKIEGIDEEKINEEVIEEVNNRPCVLARGAYKLFDNPGVYYVTDSCTKRAFNNPEIFFTYFTSYNNIKIVEKSILDQVPNDFIVFAPLGYLYNFTDGNLIKTPTHPAVYLVTGIAKHHIVSESIFNMLGFAWNKIKDVTQTVLNNFEDGVVIDEGNYGEFLK